MSSRTMSAWPACRWVSVAMRTRAQCSVSWFASAGHQGTWPIASSGSASMVAAGGPEPRRYRPVMRSRDSSGAANISDCGSDSSQASWSGQGRPKTSPKYPISPQATCLSRPSRLVPVGTRGRRMSYSDRPSSFHSRASRPRCRYWRRSALQSASVMPGCYAGATTNPPDLGLLAGRAYAGAAEGEDGQADREDDQGRDPAAPVGRRAGRPGQRLGVVRDQRELADGHEGERPGPGDEPAGDEREDQADAGEAHDVLRHSENAAGQVDTGLRVVGDRRAEGQQPDGGPA